MSKMKKTRKPGGGRKKLKPEYDAGKNLKDQMGAAVALYEEDCSLQSIADVLNLNPIKVRKLLITAGVYESEVAEEVQDTFERYRKTQDYKTSMEYVLIGDYYLPALKVPRTRPVGRWGMLHKAYLKLRKPAYYQSLLLNGKLDAVLADVEEQAAERYEVLIEQMSQRESISEKLKEENQMEWVRRMSNLENSAAEIVKAELIYSFEGR